MIGFSPTGVVCSRAGCEADASWNINWRNPRIHDATRVKVWLACDAHRDWFAEYLSGRDFPVAVTPLGESVDSVRG